jgi:hypothetical protein
MNIASWIAVGRLVIFMAFGLRDLVVEAAKNDAVAGSEKFAAVKAALITIGKMMGIAEKALNAADGIINERIENTYQAAKADGTIDAVKAQ